MSAKVMRFLAMMSMAATVMACDESSASEGCPVAKCRGPDAYKQAGCVLTDLYEQNVDGKCCPRLCNYEVDGVVCELVDEPAENEGMPCISNETTNSKMGCPVASCLAPPAGCTLVEKFSVNGDGLCCPRMCYSERSDGTPCEEFSGAQREIKGPLLVISLLSVLYLS